MRPRLLLLISIFMIINACLAGVPKVLMIKRQLASSDGSVINGDTTIAICIYDVGCGGDDCPDACTGDPIVCDTQVVTISGGFFYFKLDLSSVGDEKLSDTLYLMVSVKNGGSYEDLCPRETLYATHTYALSSHVADKSYDSDSLGGHPPDYYLDNTVDTFIAHWDSIRNMPAGFADGVDNEGIKGEGKIYSVAYWENESTLAYDNSLYWDAINNRLKIGPREGVIPSGLLHIDGNGVTGVEEVYIENPSDNVFINLRADWDKEAGIKFSGHFTLARLANSHDLRLMRYYNTTYEPSIYIKNNNGYVGVGTDTPSAKLDVNGTVEINGQLDMVNNNIVNLADPTNSQDAATKAYVDAQASNDDLSNNVLNDLSDVNASPSDGQVLKYNSSSGKWEAAVDDTGHFEPKDTFIAYWDSIRNIPNDIADGDDMDTFVAYWDSIRDKPQFYWINMYIKLDGDTIIDTVFNQDTVKSEELDISPKDTFVAYWDSIRNIPNDIADGDDYDTLKANWNFIINIPSGFADGTDDIGDELAGKDTFVAYWDSIRQIPSGFADGTDDIGDEIAGVDTMIAQWDSIRRIPSDISDGDDIDTFIAYWSYLRNIPSGFADGVDDTGHYEPKDTFIAYWDSIRNIPNDIADGDDIDTIKADWNNIKNMPSGFSDGVDDTGSTIGIKDTMIAYWDSLRNVPSSLADGDDIDTFVAHWDSIRNLPVGFADGVDDIGNDSADDLSDNVLNDLSNVDANPTDGQVLKYDAETGKWIAANDSVGSGGGGSGLWADSSTYITTIYSNRGIFRYGSICNSTEGGTTHVNLGYNSETGTSGENNEYCTVCGGYNNKAYKIACTIAGGYKNRADGNYYAVLSGYNNYAHGPNNAGLVCGGWSNEAYDDVATVCGGGYNYAGVHGFVGGGMYNEVQDKRGAICGGAQNAVYQDYGFIGGGNLNKTYGTYSVVAGGWMNEAHGDLSAILGGRQNKTYGAFSFAFGYQAEDNSVNNIFTVYWSNGGCVFVETPKDSINTAKRDSNSLYVTGNATITNKLIVKSLHSKATFLNVKVINSSETIDDSTTVYICDASGGTITLTLTEPLENSNRLIIVKKMDDSSNKVTIDAGSSTIDGSQTYDLTTQYQSVVLICDGSEWWIIADK